MLSEFPTMSGVKTIGMPTLPPGWMTVPFAGTAETEKGALGNTAPVTVSGCAPLLERTALSDCGDELSADVAEVDRRG